MPKPTRKHRVVLHVTFDRPCSVAQAVAAVKDSMWGDFYPDAPSEDDPQKFTTRGASRAPSKKGGRRV